MRKVIIISYMYTNISQSDEWNEKERERNVKIHNRLNCY